MVVNVKLFDIVGGEEYLVNEAACLAQLPRVHGSRKKREFAEQQVESLGFVRNLLMTRRIAI